VFESFLQSRHRYGPDAVGYLIAGHASGPDDVLAMLLLARWAECYDKRTGEVPFDLAPMFETIDTLEHCGEAMRSLLDIPLYRRHLEARGRRQCVLVGYSESNKEGGFCASRVAVYEAQRELAQTLASHHESHVMFHARGGSTPRGGGRVDALVRSVPAEAVNSVLRFTEEGEVVNHSYGLHQIAMRTLERAFSSLCRAASDARRGVLVPVSAENRECARTVALASREAYDKLIREDGFSIYFRHVTPIDVIERMQIGSRPAYRTSDRGLESLRPVPWVFAWTQSRHLLPGWYGAGTGLRTARDLYGIETLRQAYESWFFFHTLIDDLEAMLARADLEVARVYDSLAPEALQKFAQAIREEFAVTSQHVLEIKQVESLLDKEPTLQRSIRLRNPYVDPMNLLQVDLLQRWRASGRQDRDLFDGLLASISGIAQGLQSTG
jgi:phosphoenolpyruvate carboxylase